MVRFIFQLGLQCTTRAYLLCIDFAITSLSLSFCKINEYAAAIRLQVSAYRQTHIHVRITHAYHYLSTLLANSSNKGHTEGRGTGELFLFKLCA